MPREPRTWQPAVSAALGLILVLVSARLFTTVPDRQAEERAYTAASACPAGTSGTRADDCLMAVPARVERKEHEATRGRGKDWLHVVVSGSDTARRIRMDDAGGPVYRSVEPGDRVTVTYWRGEIRGVGADGLTQATRATPVDGWRTPMGIGLALLPMGLMFLWNGWWLRYRHRPGTSPARYVWSVSAAWVAAVLLGAWAFFASGTGSGVPDVLLAAVYGVLPAAVLSGLLMWAMRRRLRRANDTGDVVPVPPAGRRVVPASVRGNVPYAVDGYGLLVVGDGRPSATPDPGGRVGLRELAGTLTVAGVRGFRIGEDPEQWFQAYKWNGVAIECRDGDETVLIAAKRRDAPVILGALNATAGARA
ncbi:hypothetical protein J7I94_22615 [Streptomyces sp. ISL-12]|uniref:hypothetical protein n=1 Tax=Streptomyces sp. ISL-12 TaxID=2819177 RepID=UPI001BEB8923|nr:hypothetical protein [Streptomyces sp. ISL-12]MBT2413321.1 hypothetical protein [Streptomyces sp. ISL-12]